MKFKQYIHTALIAAIVVCSTTACKKNFLEVIPKGKLIPTTTHDFDMLMNYSGYYYSRAGFWQPAMLMGDEMAAEIAKFNTTSYLYAGYMFKWQDDIFIASAQQSSTSDRPEFLTKALSNIYSLNVIINNVMSASDGTAAEKADIQGQAMASRAFINFQLINYFAKPYTSATAASDPGFPMITTDDIRRTDFPRGTVQEAYDFIVADLQKAIAVLNVSPVLPTRMSKPAAEAMLGKVYLFMGKDAEALSYLDKALQDVQQMKSKPKLYDYNLTLAPGGSFYPINALNGPNSPFANMTDLTESVVARISYAGTSNGVGYPNDFLSVTPKTLALFGDDDRRLLLYSDKQRDLTPIPMAINGPKRLRKYGLSYARIGIELPELYLLRAEAFVRTGKLDNAKADIEYLRMNRMPKTSATVPQTAMKDKTSLLAFIMDERIR
ncbi:RagB/SusD family nutrient uptake outer membrane protein, partial [Sphingobacterium sp.]|uniref:RagB/SusD family nutrient uptake outer membrane protein n=1 Tax=Sphingobacterium sp. TaxID=341027 RepID=UPI00289D1DB9